jgi:hypothetical protein
MKGGSILVGQESISSGLHEITIQGISRENQNREIEEKKSEESSAFFFE